MIPGERALAGLRFDDRNPVPICEPAQCVVGQAVEYAPAGNAQIYLNVNENQPGDLEFGLIGDAPDGPKVVGSSGPFNDGAWPSGPAKLGYGSGGEATAVSFGPDANNKYITTYFRRAFTVATPALFTGLTLTLQRDDGAVVYLNGTEVFRSNMPAGTISSSTLASTDYTDIWWWQIAVNPALLVAGTNVLAVEVHQFALTSTDLAFDLQLLGDTGSLTLSSVTRGPYLQTGTPTSLVIRWRTDTATNSRVLFGTDIPFDMADLSAREIAQWADPQTAARVLGENALSAYGLDGRR